MSSSDTNSDDENYVLFKDRPDCKDVTPIEQDDEDQIVSIQYSDKFKDVHNYLRAVVKSGEKSERTLELTKVAAEENPANYTVWQLRRDILKELQRDLHGELDFLNNFVRKHSKNYQVWHHRRLLVEWTNDPSQEETFTSRVLAQDAKNYHAWQHRQWFMKTFNLFENELNFVEDLLNDDIRNNSAWNQRYFILNNTTGFPPEELKKEILYTLEKIKEVTENESAWNYLRGLLLHDQDGLSKNSTVASFCQELYTANIKSPFLLALIVDICVEKMQENEIADPPYNVENALALCSDLEQKYDKIRAKYWKHMAETIQKRANGEEVEDEGFSTNE